MLIAVRNTATVIDEADRLKVVALEQVRDLLRPQPGGRGADRHARTGEGLARYPQFHSRVGFVHEYRRLSPEAVRSLLHEGWRPPEATLPDAGWEAEAVLAAICRITGGNFRLPHRLPAQMARLATINELTTVTRPLVETARESLVIGVV